MPSSASARFRRASTKKKATTEYLTIYAWKKVLCAPGLKTSKGDGKTTFATSAALIAAFAIACEQAEAEGWKEYGPPTTWRDRISESAPKKPSAAECEKRFEALTVELADALASANGKRALEKKAIAAALTKYGDLKVLLDANRLENAIHFFAVDGVGLKKKRKPALRRVSPDEKTLARWLELVTATVDGRESS